jgi:hypothetical protein
MAGAIFARVWYSSNSFVPLGKLGHYPIGYVCTCDATEAHSATAWAHTTRPSHCLPSDIDARAPHSAGRHER